MGSCSGQLKRQPGPGFPSLPLTSVKQHATPWLAGQKIWGNERARPDTARQQKLNSKMAPKTTGHEPVFLLVTLEPENQTPAPPFFNSLQ